MSPHGLAGQDGQGRADALAAGLADILDIALHGGFKQGGLFPDGQFHFSQSGGDEFKGKRAGRDGGFEGSHGGQGVSGAGTAPVGNNSTKALRGQLKIGFSETCESLGHPAGRFRRIGGGVGIGEKELAWSVGAGMVSFATTAG